MRDTLGILTTASASGYPTANGNCSWASPARADHSTRSVPVCEEELTVCEQRPECTPRLC
eukprot:scaffold3151_cov385-Prasinococcus_capsulatus_cf.AAC.8